VVEFNKYFKEQMITNNTHTLVSLVEPSEFKLSTLKTGNQGILLSSGLNIYNGKYTIQVLWVTGETSNLVRYEDSWTESSITAEELATLNPVLAAVYNEHNS
jgi:hypothetical protein